MGGGEGRGGTGTRDLKGQGTLQVPVVAKIKLGWRTVGEITANFASSCLVEPSVDNSLGI